MTNCPRCPRLEAALREIRETAAGCPSKTWLEDRYVNHEWLLAVIDKALAPEPEQTCVVTDDIAAKIREGQ
jgi:hypothetical protein